ncbi:MAG: fluoride efflux transporter CrcB [Desulfatibacillum sp.]|nr:fluoride efflux transporter CrcB [Desulfatibacillum sp.]
METGAIKLLVIGLGGFVGAISRYLIGGWVHRLFPGSTFPLGTMTVNVAGCFLIGLGWGLIETRGLFSPNMRALLLVGFLGSLTTFSTFGFETFQLARNGQTVWSILNITLSLVLGLLAVIGGNAASRML